MVCLALLEKYNGVFNAEQCGGYSFDTSASAAKPCRLYKGRPVTSVSTEFADASGWFCWNMTVSDVAGPEGGDVLREVVSTPAPPTAEELAAADKSLPTLNINVLPDARTAQIMTYTSANDECYKPFQVITLQDMAFQTIKVRVKASEWDTFLEMIPASVPLRRLSATAGHVSAVFADRVIYGATGAAPLQKAAPVVAGVAAAVAAPAAGAAEVEEKKPTCKKMPPASSMPISVIITNIVVGAGILACGFGGYKGGEMFASHRVNAMKGGYGLITDGSTMS